MISCGGRAGHTFPLTGSEEELKMSRAEINHEVSRLQLELKLPDTESTHFSVVCSLPDATTARASMKDLPKLAQQNIKTHFSSYQIDEINQLACDGNEFYQIKIARHHFHFEVIYSGLGQVQLIKPYQPKS